MSTPIFQLTDVTKHVGNFTLQKISLEVPLGYIIGLIGANGSGKTTLLHLLLGLYRPEEGTVLIDGKSYPEDERSLHDEMGCVLQERLFDRDKTLLQNAGFYGKYYSAYRQEDFLNYCREFDLSPDRSYKKLSKGEELKFQFAFALSHHPKLLLLDEPTGNFDPQFRSKFLKILQDFISDGRHSIVLATHLTEDLDRFADYILYMEKGKLLLSMDIENLRETYRLVTGETYKIRLLPAESILSMEQGDYGTRALVLHKRWMNYDRELTVAPPTIEELMYFMAKRGKRN